MLNLYFGLDLKFEISIIIILIGIIANVINVLFVIECESVKMPFSTPPLHYTLAFIIKNISASSLRTLEQTVVGGLLGWVFFFCWVFFLQ